MKRLGLLVTLLLVIGVAPAALAINLDVEANLSGFNEVHFNAGRVDPPPIVPPSLLGAISTEARGKFEARIDTDARIMAYELSYEALRGNVTQAHIHFGQKHTVGGIIVWLCQTTTNPAPAAVAAETPTCEGPRDGRVTGIIGPNQVLAQTPQGFLINDFDALVRAIQAGAAYANVHSILFGPGEIRGQIEQVPAP